MCGNLLEQPQEIDTGSYYSSTLEISGAVHTNEHLVYDSSKVARKTKTVMSKPSKDTEIPRLKAM